MPLTQEQRKRLEELRAMDKPSEGSTPKMTPEKKARLEELRAKAEAEKPSTLESAGRGLIAGVAAPLNIGADLLGVDKPTRMIEAASRGLFNDKDYSENLHDVNKREEEAKKTNPDAYAVGEWAPAVVGGGKLAIEGVKKAAPLAVKGVKGALALKGKAIAKVAEETGLNPKTVEYGATVLTDVLGGSGVATGVKLLSKTKAMSKLFDRVKAMGPVTKEAVEEVAKAGGKELKEVAPAAVKIVEEAPKLVDELAPKLQKAAAPAPVAAKEAGEEVLQDTVEVVTKNKGVDLDPVEKIKLPTAKAEREQSLLDRVAEVSESKNNTKALTAKERKAQEIEEFMKSGKGHQYEAGQISDKFKLNKGKKGLKWKD